MLYQIIEGTVSAGGNVILSHINFEIRGNEKIAVVGSNGAGKTTLLKLIAGELELDRDDKRQNSGINAARKLTTGYLKQQASEENERTVEEEIFSSCSFSDDFSQERFEYEQEYDRLFTGFGFLKSDKKKKISEFSGGEQTKIALIRHLLLKPDILLLDEPTNHLDIQTVQWLEEYLSGYKKAVVMVSHDRFFLDQTVSVIYELSGKTLTRYTGSYTQFRAEKRKRIRLQTKAYEMQQEEKKRLNDLVERFKHKPNKAAFARSKRKAAERLVPVEKPVEDEVHLFVEPLEPAILGSKWVFEAEHLKIGYEKPLAELSLRIRRGQKIGILGANGAGKSTLLKTAAGLIPGLTGEYSLGNHITIGYFDQQSSQLLSEKSVADHFHDLFPALTEKEVRSILGAYLFGGKEASKRVDVLSGGEKARLVLAELLQSRPNFLILDEPTNHMDIQAKETLESAFSAFTGTILFVSHDRYFLDRVAESILIFEDQSVFYYPFGYAHYLERKRRGSKEGIAAQMRVEEQALIAGIRAVPKAERHRLKEISSEEAYVDWKMGPVTERLMKAGELVEELTYACEKLLKDWQESQEIWSAMEWSDASAYEELKRQQEEAWEKWTALCLEWYDETLNMQL
ncbi:ABC-F family ATP-binding cassette domain-containing protein [Clostridium boliviensis]|uniref:ABC-F family ATP-binding cassette domain-containing protein n=1 Tax=Clostridium boliviensis TaxID=318465 RepID=A0ABU4GI78_9CLOT|nr:ABC-F family ATP-binding cassette domain-containing protein [Clostridium boliviensis]MDW2797321.1 ABC-F family ATP-binding cassette domain-containing protein [Clostridium boliviensis]